jgi:hypothetical protein
MFTTTKSVNISLLSGLWGLVKKFFGGRTMERPILFSTPMVQAILGGKKSMTRRVIKPQPTRPYWCGIGHGWDDGHGYEIKCPYGKPGDNLWVRETWGNYSEDDPECNAAYYLYRADYPLDAKGYWYEPEHINFCDFPKWRPSIHMPRAACRLRLKISDIRIERLQDITKEDAKAEGIDIGRIDEEMYEKKKAYALLANHLPVAQFADLWNGINIKRGYGWDTNPWVYVVSFERVEVLG